MVLKDKKTKITFHNGILSIGGTIIEVAYEDSHIFFDFGSEYNPKDTFQPSNLQELLDAKLVPFLDHMYDQTIELDGYASKGEKFANTAVFLSHVHLDHSKMINYLDPSIPLYTLKGTKALLETLNINDDFLFPLAQPHTKNTREICGVEDNTVVEIGKIKVQVMPVDHDAYGACGLVITTPDLKISYTGDLRLHGYREADTIAFTKASEEADVLMIEGVSVSFAEVDAPVSEGGDTTETSLLENINHIINTNPNKQLTFNYYIANVERIMNIIKTCTREVVLDAYSAYVVKAATGYEVKYYRLDDNREYGLDSKLEVAFSELLADTTRFFWQLSGAAVKYIDQMQKGGIYIHSNAVPLGEFDPLYKPFVESFAEHGITFMRLACSGHAHPQDLMRIINLVKPKLLVPIHSYHPERLTNANGDRLLPEKGQTI